jgi:hypothetical protein
MWPKADAVLMKTNHQVFLSKQQSNSFSTNKLEDTYLCCLLLCCSFKHLHWLFSCKLSASMLIQYKVHVPHTMDVSSVCCCSTQRDSIITNTIVVGDVVAIHCGKGCGNCEWLLAEREKPSR